MKHFKKILLIGCGNMGLTLLKGWLNLVDVKNISVVTPNYLHLPQEKRVNYFHPKDINKNFLVEGTIIIFAVKPQLLHSILPSYSHLIGKNNIFVSIAAGVNISFYQKYFGKKEIIIRAMPNMLMKIKQGFTGLYCLSSLDTVIKSDIEFCFCFGGLINWLDKENDFHLVTAISGSGPAFVYFFINILRDIGLELQLKEGLVDIMIKQLLIGCGKSYEIRDLSLEKLIDEVASPQGTTEAGLSVLIEHKYLYKLMKRAIVQSVDKSYLLSKINEKI